MPQINANGITLEYEDRGTRDAPVILLIMGLGAQMTLWPDELIDALVAEGFRVIRYDNRDIGLSQKMEGAKFPGPAKQILLGKIGLKPAVPYTLADMADDAAALLDALAIDRAHIVGASMGGMIAQLVAANHPGKTITLTSIMSTTGNPKLPAAKKEAMDVLTRRPDSADEVVLVAHGMKIARVIGSPGYPVDEEALRDRVTKTVRRSVYPAGMQRQLAAILHDGDRRARLSRIEAPTLVIHGEDDPLVPCAGGRDTAASIAGARIETFPGMGHDLPLPLVDRFAALIAEHARGAA
ncbi:alpha/beta fold hydrolase [Erythrobacter sp. 3-20A1M]|uniref:alpha/beta fold hydrolase n=1 Tax=Erythrobacter sp. 3-20A1M TaxID=2653850 RepID=UPI001BFC8602|nr:alpha/beta hydrolase [Erythrobacter sp. 3-20A1M]QWC56620.1 alpha/beta fold hydrolase [Erythrobacter sp. 3-20A1M]